MFKDCENLKLLDLRNLYFSNVQTYLNIFEGTNSNLTACIDNDNNFFYNYYLLLIVIAHVIWIQIIKLYSKIINAY